MVRGLLGARTVALAASVFWACPASADFIVDGPGLRAVSGVISFDTGGAAQGQVVGGEFEHQGAGFRGFTFDENTLGQDSAAGFHAGSLVSGIVTQPGGDLIIQFNQAITAADFAFIGDGSPRTLTVLFGGPSGGRVLAQATIDLPAARSIAVHEAQQNLSNAKLAASGDQLRLSIDQSKLNLAADYVSTDENNISIEQNLIKTAQAQIATDRSKLSACGADIGCTVIWSSRLAQDEKYLDRLNSTLSAEELTLAADEATKSKDQSIVDGDNRVLRADQAVEATDQASVTAAAHDPAGGGFIGFEGLIFDTLVLSDANDPTAIDNVQFVSLLAPPPGGGSSPHSGDAPEPASAALMGGALLSLLGLRRVRAERR